MHNQHSDNPDFEDNGVEEGQLVVTSWWKMVLLTYVHKYLVLSTRSVPKAGMFGSIRYQKMWVMKAPAERK